MPVINMIDEEAILPSINLEKTIRVISKFIKNNISISQTDGLVLGLSGGVDSSTVAYLCAKVVHPQNILGLILPSDTTTTEDIKHAKLVANNLGIDREIIYIDDILNSFQNICDHPTNNKLVKANLKARIRMIILYYHANSLNKLVVGTGNRTEILVGYFTKYGDGGVDILPLGDVYKTQVRQLASELGVPAEIIKKPPTAGLWSGQKDEDELGIKYPILDNVLHLAIDKKLENKYIARKLNIPLEEVERVKDMVSNSIHKSIPIPIPRVR